MKKVYNIIFIITLVLTLGLVTNVKASAQLTEANGGRITVTRNVTHAMNPVSNTFIYSITADSNNPVAVTGIPNFFNVVFNRVALTNFDEEGYGTATQTGTLDLTGVTFSKVGDYLFTLREIGSNNSRNYRIDEDNYYTIKVSVRYEVDANNVPTSTMTATVANIKNSSNTKVNDVVFSKYFDPESINITKQVRGNMADKDEYFKIIVNIDCLTGDEYYIHYLDENENEAPASITYNGSTINRMTNHEQEGETDDYYGTYTCGIDNYIYLKHGEKAYIYGLLDGQEYSFTEQGALLYKTYINDSETNNKTSGNLTVGEDACYDDSSSGGGDEPIYHSHKTSDVVEPSFLGEQTAKADTKSLANTTACSRSMIINEYDSIIDTGLVLKFLPYVLIVLTAIGGLTVFIISKRKNKNNLDNTDSEE